MIIEGEPRKQIPFGAAGATAFTRWAKHFSQYGWYPAAKPVCEVGSSTTDAPHPWQTSQPLQGREHLRQLSIIQCERGHTPLATFEQFGWLHIGACKTFLTVPGLA